MAADAVSAYERLRRAALDPTHGPIGELGMALLMRRGMAAWAKQSAATTPSHSTPPRAGVDTPALSRAAQTQLTSLLVSMLIGSLDRTEAICS